MKKRIQIDSAILSLVILLTAVVCWFYRWYPLNQTLDNFTDFFGVMFILKGSYMRMAARGHKKANSGKGSQLVVTGPYSVIRNPMYFGTFLTGCGFILTLWPWWILPIFALLFYLRFQRQINIEEEHLKKLFGAKFESYAKEVPPLFPKISTLRRVNVKETFPWKEAFSTKDKYNLIAWPLAAFILEMAKDKFLLHQTDFSQTFFVFALAVIVFAFRMWWEYFRE